MNTPVVNKFLFSWDMTGIESIVPLNAYEDHEVDNTAAILRGEEPTRNPLDKIVFMILTRARANTHRRYEVYTVCCDESMDEEFWKKQWRDYPQETADLVREKGNKLFSDRIIGEVKIR